MKEALSFALCLVVAWAYLVGCKPALSVAEIVFRKLACALEHRDDADEDILRECAVDERDAKNILDLVGKARAHDAEIRAGVCK